MDVLYDRKTLRAFLERHGLWARKALAQHFLCSKSAVEAILARMEGCTGALEIGPGPGVLTSALSATIGKVIALEVDPRMLPALSESAPNAEIRLQDALECDIEAILRELPEPRALVSNMPYHITGPLLTRVAEARGAFTKAVLMMQREVADRILAPAGNSNRGSLSVFLEAQFEVKRVCQVPAGAFYPPPKVDSTVLEFVPRSTGLTAQEEPGFFAMVRCSFRAPRKTLANNLSTLHTRDTVVSALLRCGLTADVRPHMLSIESWVALFRNLEPAP